MVRELLDLLISFIKSRLFILCVIFFAMFSILVYRVFELQIVKGDYYLENYVQKAKRTRYTAGTRGNIYDRNGELLAYNQLTYAVMIEDVLEDTENKNEELNGIIQKTIQLIEGNGDSLVNEFPIFLNKNNEYVFSSSLTEKGRQGALRDLYGKRTIEELDSETEHLSDDTAEQVMQYLREERYKLNEEVSKEEALKIIMVRYNLSLNRYQKYILSKIASNVSNETVAAIYENENTLKGVSITEETIRVYNDSTYFAHILGYTGNISDSQLEEYNEKEEIYDSNDVVGKSGIEATLEDKLQGKKGKETIFVDSTGKVLEVEGEEEEQAGNDVYLTIDRNLQIATYNILEQKLAGILLSKIVNKEEKDIEKNPNEAILIPIKEVYYQLINNNVVDLTRFNRKKATENEKYIYEKFKSKQANVLEMIEQEMQDEHAVSLKKLSEENNTYLSFAYDKLKSDSVGILVESAIDKEDEVYAKWIKESISFREFMLYAISKNWIDTTKLSMGEKYSTQDMVYTALTEYLKETLEKDTRFSKKIYYYMIEDGTVTGNEVCMLLYDQKILEEDTQTYEKLKYAGADYAYEFILEQIRLIHITPAQLALDPCSGSCVVTDVNNGQVLALVTYPSYDNNKMSGSVDTNYWNQLNDDLSTPLLNRATMTRTAPGSTFKMLTAIAGLEEGVINPGERIQDKGQFEEVSPSPKCWKFPGSHGLVDVSDALGVSCNYFFYQVGYLLGTTQQNTFNSELGLSKMKKYATLLGLTDKSGVEIGEYDPIFSTESAVHSAIGQGSNSYANIQLARYITTIANSGNNYELTLIDKVVDSKGNIVDSNPANLQNTVDIAQSTWDAVHVGMREVITEGTAETAFKGCDIEVAGKSGTAQENKLRSNHSLFVAYSPYRNPKVGLSVLIPHGDSSGYTAEIVRDVLEYYNGKTKLKDILKGTAAVPKTGITSD